MKFLSRVESTSLLGILKQGPLYATAFFYGVSIFTWFLALKSLPLNVAYPLQAFGYVLVSVLAWLIFSETLEALQLLALGLILAGVLLLAFTYS